MSMSSSSARRPSISYPIQSQHLQNLLFILRRSNEHYRQVAESLRRSMRPTSHARKRAYNLGLSVDIHKAVNCPQQQVSVVPLPIIDACLSPSSPLARAASEDAIMPSIIPYDVRLPGRSRAEKRMAIIPPIIIPSIRDPRRRPSIVAQLTSQGVTSRFSAITPEDPPTDISLPVFNIHIWDSNMDLHHTEQVVPDDVSPLTDDVSEVNRTTLTPVYVGDYDDDVYMDMAVSEDESRVFASSASSTSDGSSVSSRSCGPRTPADRSPMMICNKRKSFEEEERLDGQPPKYIRKLDHSIAVRR
ncbi:hypothetical protein Moror_12653 [Moniliophthora roreri MCA 2997]|uniref:Uncharacterized protein n=2 Tax=Moniliophthora roreri TaxID=221103 RepID=V2YV70_MONRO|nr:hypothetical protein Moror_12653 [Moniliophthora roreri MCA 2997]KAI3615657.1 hypothetical protein WG66_011853 [Moniliophthora roreri]